MVAHWLDVNSEGIACSILLTAVVAIDSAVSFLFLNALSCFELLVLLTCKYSPKQVVPIVVWGFPLVLLCVVFRDGSMWTGVSGVVVKLMRRWIRHCLSWIGSVWTGVSGVVVKLTRRWIRHCLSWNVDGWGLGGLGGGWTLLGSNPISQFPRHSFIHVFIPASLSDGTSAAGT
jgi:hypothetical protein